MNKRKKEPSEGNNELNVSKAKRSLRENSQLTAENNFEIPVQPQSNDSKRKSKPTTAGTKQEREEKSQENTEALAVNLQTSSNDEERKTTSEPKQLSQAKEFISLPLSQNSAGKFVPVFAKPKKGLTETPERNDGESAGFQTEQTVMMHKLQEILESNLQCTDSNLACESSEADMQEAKFSPESFQLMGSKVQEAGDMEISHCQKCTSEGLDVKTQNQQKIKNISTKAAMVGDSHQGTGIASNLQEDNCDKNTFVELVPLFPDTLCHKDAGSHENRNLSLGSLECPIEKDVSCSILTEYRISDRGKGNQNEDLLNSCLENVDQKIPTEDEIAIKLGNFVKEEKETKDVHGEVIDLMDTSIKSKMESNLMKPQFLVDLNITTDKEKNNSCTRGRGEEQSSSDKGAEQNSPFKDDKAAEQNSLHSSGKIAEHSDLCSAGKIADRSSSKSSVKTTQQSSPCVSAEVVVEQRGNCKVTEQSSSQSSSGRVSEKINSDKDRGTSGKDFLSSTPSMIVDLKMDVEATELKSIQATETTCLFCIQTEGRGHLQCNNTSLQTAFYNGESYTGKEEAEKKSKTSVGTRAESDPNASTPLIDNSFICENNQEDYITLESGKENGSEKVRPGRKQSPFSICDSRPNSLEVKQSNTEIVPKAATQIPEAGIKSSPLSFGLPLNVKNNEEMVICEKNKMDPVPMENCLSPIDVLEQLEREKVIINHKRETDANSGVWNSLSAADTGLPSNALRDPSPVDQTCSPWEDALSLDLELLPDNPIQTVLEDNRVEFPLKQRFSVDSNCSPSIPESDLYPERERRPKTPVPIINISYPNKLQPRVEMMEGGCDPTKEEDATDVVCGLIIELSNLNRLIMNTHRDLESLKRLKYRKSRQSGRFIAHALKGATNTLY
ncbi:break repair meiotic recombinase recruitment factor 1 isoform X3 [Mauremys mutica]|nr:break repair meiotic recombinase recruitment factor 1 isoform X3 [Mauremys mutica]